MAGLPEAAALNKLFKRTDSELPPPFTTTRSDLPSPLRSDANTHCGKIPVANVRCVAKLAVDAPAAVVLLLIRTERFFVSRQELEALET